MLEKLTAMQDRLLQRCLKSSQPFRISIPEMLEKLTAMLSHARKDAAKMPQKLKVVRCSRDG